MISVFQLAPHACPLLFLFSHLWGSLYNSPREVCLLLGSRGPACLERASVSYVGFTRLAVFTGLSEVLDASILGPSGLLLCESDIHVASCLLQTRCWVSAFPALLSQLPLIHLLSFFLNFLDISHLFCCLCGFIPLFLLGALEDSKDK